MLQLQLQTEFKYSSSYWTNKETYAVDDGLEGLTEKQSKLASYWNTPFHKICLGMKVENVRKWIRINDIRGTSLFNVIAGGVFENTTVGKEVWKSLISAPFFQENCNLEGLNVQQANTDYDNHVKVRIGIVANNQNDCTSCDSCIGFGISIRSCNGYDLTSTSCGTSKAGCFSMPNQNMAAFGYIFVQ